SEFADPALWSKSPLTAAKAPAAEAIDETVRTAASPPATAGRPAPRVPGDTGSGADELVGQPASRCMGRESTAPRTVPPRPPPRAVTPPGVPPGRRGCHRRRASALCEGVVGA